MINLVNLMITIDTVRFLVIAQSESQLTIQTLDEETNKYLIEWRKATLYPSSTNVLTYKRQGLIPSLPTYEICGLWPIQVFGSTNPADKRYTAELNVDLIRPLTLVNNPLDKMGDIPDKKRTMNIRMNHLGTLSLLAECAVHLSGPEANEIRDQIDCCLTDASRLKLIRFKRVLSSFEVEPYSS